MITAGQPSCGMKNPFSWVPRFCFGWIWLLMLRIRHFPVLAKIGKHEKEEPELLQLKCPNLLSPGNSYRLIWKAHSQNKLVIAGSVWDHRKTKGMSQLWGHWWNICCSSADQIVSAVIGEGIWIPVVTRGFPITPANQGEDQCSLPCE